METNHKGKGFAKTSWIEILRVFGSNPEGLGRCCLQGRHPEEASNDEVVSIFGAAKDELKLPGSVKSCNIDQERLRRVYFGSRSVMQHSELPGW